MQSRTPDVNEQWSVGNNGAESIGLEVSAARRISRRGLQDRLAVLWSSFMHVFPERGQTSA